MDDPRPSDEQASGLLELVAHPDRLAWLSPILREFCHLLRNRLNATRLSLYLAQRLGSDASTAESWSELDQGLLELQRLVEQFQAICRPMAIVPIRAALGTLLEERRTAWQDWLRVRGRWLEMRPPLQSAVGCFDPTRLAQGLDALTQWRASEGAVGTPIRLSWWTDDRLMHLRWSEPASSFDPGSRDPAPADAEPVTALALPLLARIVTAHQGNWALDMQGGLCLDLRWPLELRASAR